MNKKNKSSLLALCLSLSVLNGCTYINVPFLKTNSDKAIISWSKGNHEEAIHYAQKALQKNPQDTYAMMIAGLSYERLGYKERAKPFFEQVAVSETGEIGVFGSMKNVPDEELKRAAMRRLSLLEVANTPFVTVNPSTQMPVFQEVLASEQKNGNVQVVVAEKIEPVKSGLDMLEEGDLNIVMRFITFSKLRDEKYVTQEEWAERRSVNLGGLLTYTLPPAAQGLQLPAPSADVIIERLNALRQALEIRAISPREHAAEREIILEALLPANPFYRMEYPQPAQDILEAATSLRRLEMLKNMKLITPTEAEKEAKVIEAKIYKKLGMKKRK